MRTTARGQTARGVGRGDRAASARRKLELKRAFRLGKTKVLRANNWRGAPLFTGIQRGRVKWLALASAKASGRRVKSDLRRAR